MQFDEEKANKYLGLGTFKQDFGRGDTIYDMLFGSGERTREKMERKKFKNPVFFSLQREKTVLYYLGMKNAKRRPSPSFWENGFGNSQRKHPPITQITG